MQGGTVPKLRLPRRHTSDRAVGTHIALRHWITDGFFRISLKLEPTPTSESRPYTVVPAVRITGLLLIPWVCSSSGDAGKVGGEEVPNGLGSISTVRRSKCHHIFVSWTILFARMRAVGSYEAYQYYGRGLLEPHATRLMEPQHTT